MMRQLSLRRAVPVTLAIALAVLSGCRDAGPTAPTVDAIELARGGGGGPKVNSTEPDTTSQGTVSLLVRVFGSGFDEGSSVAFRLGDSTNAPTLITESTEFVKKSELRAVITVSVEADVGLYDVVVTTSRGKKGIGSELFAVKEKTNGGGPSSSSVELVGMEVQVLRDGQIHGMTDVPTVDAGITAARTDQEFVCRLGAPDWRCTPEEQETFFGCPDTNQPCGKILFTFSGGVDEDNIGFWVSHSIQGCVENEIVIGGCVYDENLVNRWRAASWSQAYQPRVLIGEVTGTDALTDNGDGTRTLTVYWQGQRGQRRLSDNQVVWSRYPDLNPQLGTDYFEFRAASGSRTFQVCTLIPTCWTEYRGDPGTQAYVVLDDIQLVTQGRGKKTKTSGIAFEIQAFTDPVPVQPDGSIDYRDPGVVASNLESWASVMLVDASGKQMLAIQSAGINPDDPDKPEIYTSGFRFTFPETGCYEFHLLEVFVQDVDHLEYVWYSQLDIEAIKVLRVDHVEGGETTVTPGSTCSP